VENNITLGEICNTLRGAWAEYGRKSTYHFVAEGFLIQYQVVYNFLMLITTRDQVITKIKANRRALKRYGVKSLALFGSTARDKMRKRGDVDVLVQFDKSTWAN